MLFSKFSPHVIFHLIVLCDINSGSGVSVCWLMLGSPYILCFVLCGSVLIHIHISIGFMSVT